MASLKVWHWFENPLEPSNRLVALNTLSPSTAAGYVEFTNWGLPDTSVIANAPANYIAYLRVGLRDSNKDNWEYFTQTFRCSSGIDEPNNVVMFMPRITSGYNYNVTYLRGDLEITVDSANNRWKIHIFAIAYLPDGQNHATQDSAVSADGAALQGVNIYY